MIERIIIIDSVDPLVFYGVNNANMHLIRNLFPKLRIAARGSVIKVIGEDSETAEFEKKINELSEHAQRFNRLSEENILDIVKGEAPKELKQDGVIIYGVNGKPITGRTPNQQKLVEAFTRNDLTFAMGPAGTGKTYIAIALAVRALKNREIKRIILTRPAVEAGERLGFLPGDLKDKLDPYLQPLYDALGDMIPPKRLQEFIEEGTIQIAPLAYMRGRTLDRACVILDEAQNTNLSQLKMFLTRMGMNAKFIVTGDATQVDLPRREDSGLLKGISLLKNIKGVSTIIFTNEDIVRHPLVGKIVKAFDRKEAGTAGATGTAGTLEGNDVQSHQD